MILHTLRTRLGIFFLLGCTVLATITRGAEVAQLAEQLRDGDVDARREAAESLGRAAATAAAALPALISALRDDDERVRANAAWALGKIPTRGAESAPALAAALADPDWSVRHNAALSLTWFGPAAIPALEKTIAGDSARAAALAISALQRIDAAKAAGTLGLLRRLLRDDDEEVRAIAAQSIGNLGAAGAAAVPELIATLDDKNQIIRGSAISALGAIGPEAREAVPALIKHVGPETSSRIRIVAANALVRIGHAREQWLPRIIAMLQPTREESVPTAGMVILSGLGPIAVPLLKEALQDPEPTVRGFASETLGMIGPAAAPAVELLITRLHDEPPEVSEKAAVALGKIGVANDNVLSALREAARAPDQHLAASAQAAVEQLSQPKKG